MAANLLDWLKLPVGDGAFYALFGFCFVLLGITLLIVIFVLLGKLMDYLRKHPRKPKKTKKTKKTVEAIEEPVPIATEDGVSPETVAVITAAIMAYYSKEQSQCDFIVKRIKKL